MDSIRRRRRSLGSENGFTLIELLVVSSLLVVVLLATASLLEHSVRNEQTVRARADGVLTARTGLEQMTRELRQAIPPVETFAAGKSVRFRRTVGGTTVWVLYDCAGDSCRRAQGATVPATATNPFVRGLQTAPDPGPAFLPPSASIPTGGQVRIQLRIATGKYFEPDAATRTRDSEQLDGGVTIRNTAPTS